MGPGWFGWPREANLSNTSSFEHVNGTMTRWFACFGGAVKLARQIGKHIPPPPPVTAILTTDQTTPAQEAVTVPQLQAEVAVFVDDHSILQWPGGRTASFSVTVLSDPQLMLSATLGAYMCSHTHHTFSRPT